MLDKEGLTQEVSVGVTYASLMSAVSLFFTGIVIAQYGSFNASIKVPLTFLIISTFSFIFAATIFSNAATELTLTRFRSVQRYMVYAKNIDELLGLYLFVLATPMVIGSVTHDGFVRAITTIVAVGAFGIYSQSRFSILDDELTRWHKRFATITIVALAGGLYFFQSWDHAYASLLYGITAVSLLGVLVLMAYVFCTSGKQYNITLLRTYDDDDADEMAEVIAKNLKRASKKSLPQTLRQAMSQLTTPAAIKRLAKEKSIVVAEFKNKVVGFAALQDDEISHVTTDPSMHRKGIGRQMVEYLEFEAAGAGFRYTTVAANSLNEHFYHKIGYTVQSESSDTAHNTVYHMKKKLRR